jgi:hypothetical protein
MIISSGCCLICRSGTILLGPSVLIRLRCVCVCVCVCGIEMKRRGGRRRGGERDGRKGIYIIFIHTYLYVHMYIVS